MGPLPVDPSRQEVFDVLSGRWTLPILLSLRDGPLRFGDLRRMMPRVSANVLTTRLRELEGLRLVDRFSLPPPARTQVYGLGEAGEDLRPMLDALADWSGVLPPHGSNTESG